MKSIWETTLKTEKKQYNALKENIKRDVVVVGGGMAGVLTAFHLAEKGLKVTLIEAERLGSGVTSKTTAHINAQQGYIYYHLKKSKSIKYAKLYLESQLQAIDLYEKIIKEQGIDCEFERVDDYFFTIKNCQKLKKLYKILNEINANVEYFENKSILGFNTKGVIKASGQAVFHPLEFLVQLKKDFEIFENTRIVKIDMDKKILFTKDHQIIANKIIIATNYPIVKLKGAYFLKLYKSHSYVASTKKNKNALKSTYHSDVENGFTFRDFNSQVIIGRLDHRTGRVNSSEKKERLEDVSKKYFNSEITNFWDANDVVTYDGLPIVGKFSEKYKDIYIITGFNKWGMANSMASSVLITNLISGQKNEFEEIFSPQRFNFSFKAFLSNIFVSLKNLLFMPLIPSFQSYNYEDFLIRNYYTSTCR